MQQERSQPLICRGFSRPITYIEHSQILPTGDFLIVGGCLDGAPQLRHGRTGDWIGTLSGHKGAVWSARFNQDATKVVTASADYTARLWSALTGSSEATYAHKRIVKSAAFSPSSHTSSVIATCGQERCIALWDIEKEDVPVLKIENAAETMMKTVLWNPHFNNCLFSSSEEKTIKCWDPRSGDLVVEKTLPEELTSLSMTKDEKFLISTAGKQVIFWNAQKFEPLLTFDTNLAANATFASLNPAADRFVVGCENFDVYRFDISGKQLDVHRGHHGPVTAVSYAPDGETFASGAGDGCIRIWLNELKEYGLWKIGGATAAREANEKKDPEENMTETKQEVDESVDAAT